MMACMPESDPLSILLHHDRWATMQLLDVCAGLSEEQLHRRFEIGPGSLHDTLTHMVAVLRTWADSLAGRDLRPRLEGDGQRRTIQQLRDLSEAAWQELNAEVRRRPLDELTTRTLRSGKVVRMTRSAILTHATTHGTHHRAQCLNMLRHLGVSPLPPSSIAEWSWVADAPA